MENKIILTKDNFARIFYQSTGILEFPNPFDYEGEEREYWKRCAQWHIWTRFEDDDNERLGWFSTYGTLSDAYKQLLREDAPIETIKTLLESEKSEYILTENGEYIEV